MHYPRVLVSESVLADIVSLAATGLTDFEISEATQLPVVDIQNNYTPEVRRGRSMLCVALRTKQLALAMQGDAKLLLHLGQHLLGQYNHMSVDPWRGNTKDCETHFAKPDWLEADQDGLGAAFVKPEGDDDDDEPYKPSIAERFGHSR